MHQTHHRRTRTLTALLAIVLITATGLTGCSDDDDVTLTPRDAATSTPAESADTTGEDAATPTSEPTATAAPTPEPTVTPEPAPTAQPTQTPDAEPSLALALDGLLVVEAGGASSTTIPFGTAEADTIAALTSLIGPPDEQNPGTSECPNGQTGVAFWSGLLRIDFGDLGFLAWMLEPGSPLTTLTGVGLDSTRADLEAAIAVEVFDSTLGVEFFAAADEGMPGVGGLLSDGSDAATIDDFWGGSICTFR